VIRVVDLAVDFFNGVQACPVPALLSVDAGDLIVRRAQAANHAGGAELLRLPLQQIRWPERTRAGVRLLHFAAGESVQSGDAAAWDAWVASHAAARDGWVVRAQQHWPLSLGALVLLVAVLAASYLWGLPWASRAALAVVPHGVDVRIGETARPQLERYMLKPSRLSAPEQREWTERFKFAIDKAYPQGGAPRYELVFRGSRIGPNALALPGGTIVITDELIDMAREAGPLADDMVVGVLAHELGHVRHRHGMQSLISASVLGMVAGSVIGDYSGALAAVPTWVGQAKYSRDAERQADQEALHVMRAAGHSPLAMVQFFKLARQHASREAQKRCVDDLSEQARQRELAANPGSTGQPAVDAASCAKRSAPGPELGIGISSHPPDHERVEVFRSAARP
jgi:Zn-dependent protease with chaperone function